MSLSSILDHVKKKGQVQHRPSSIDDSKSNTSKTNSSQSSIYKSPNKPIDPVVAMLKEKRRQEREKKEQELRDKKGLPNKKSKTTVRPSSAKASRNDSPRSQNTTRPSNKAVTSSFKPVEKPPVKKMNFNELMKKASKIDQSKLSISIRPKTKSPEASNSSQRQRLGARQQPSNSMAKPLSSSKLKESTERSKPMRPPTTKAPLPIRKPSSQLEEKLKKSSKYQKSSQRNSYEDDYDEDDESFVVSDEERDKPPDYDRDEIWAMFNKGKKRSYYDRYDDYDSDDDMEATGGEIIEEEMRSKLRAEMEDRRELIEEKRLQELKRLRKQRTN